MICKQLTNLLILVLAVVAGRCVEAQDHATVQEPPSLVGTWIIDTVNGQKTTTSTDGTREILMLNGTHFFYGRMHLEKKTVALVKKGGRYSLIDGEFTETIEFAPNKRAIGQSYTFEVSVRDGQLIKSGQLQSKQMNQVWIRFDPADGNAQSNTN